jgi:hypothetical protein
MAADSSNPRTKKTLYGLEQLLTFCVEGNPENVPYLQLYLDENSWEILCGFQPLGEAVRNRFQPPECKVPQLPAEKWELRYEELVKALVPRQGVASRWPSKPLEWNSKPFPPDEEIEEMYRKRVEDALSKMERETVNSSQPTLIQLIWSSLNMFTSIENAELDLGMSFVYNWKLGRTGAGYRIPNFLPEVVLVQEMIASAWPGLLSIDITHNNRADRTPISFLGQLSRLRDLHIPTHTGSTPEELAETLGCLRDLKTLHIVGNKAKSSTATLSVNASVIIHASSLTSLNIEEQPYQGEVAFLNMEIIDAIKAHADSLQELRIEQDRCEYIADVEVLDSLIQVLPRLTKLLDCDIQMRVPNNILSQRGYIPAREHGWDMEQYMPPGVTGIHPVKLHYRNPCWIRDEKRTPTGTYQDKYYYFEGEGWG